MNRSIVAAGLAAMLMLGACASAPPAGKTAPAQQVASNGGLVCTNEKSVGSHLPKRVCTTEEQRIRSRAEAERLMTQRGGQSNPGATAP